MLISSTRHTEADIRAWRAAEATDMMRWRRDQRRLLDGCSKAARAIGEFAQCGPCYAGFSGGKDSVLLSYVIAQMAPSVRPPLVYVEVLPHASPDVPDVIKAVEAFGVGITRIKVQCERSAEGAWLGSGRLEEGFGIAAARYGGRYISGVRSQESRARLLRQRVHGTSSERTCAPLTYLSTADVFACAAGLGLPLHPAYAMSCGGRLDREQLRVATLGGIRGAHRGRREWEMVYYRAELEGLGLATRRVD